MKAEPGIHQFEFEKRAASDRRSHCSLSEEQTSQSFAGLSLEETAEALKVSVGTMRRDWSLAEAWLFRELNEGERDDA